MENLNKFQILLSKISKGEINLSNQEDLKYAFSIILGPKYDSQNILDSFEIANIIFTYKHKFKIIGDIDDNLYIFCITMHEILVRTLRAKIMYKNIFTEWSHLIKYLQIIMGHELVEQFRLILLDNKYRFIADTLMTKGTIDQASVYIREIIATSMEYNSKNIIIVHNHPSGNCTPSEADQTVTNEVLIACQFNKIKLHDHLIIGKNEYFSFKNENRLM